MCDVDAVVIIMNVCVGGEEQPESHLEEVHSSSTDVLQQRPGKTSQGSTLKKTFVSGPSSSMLKWSHGSCRLYRWTATITTVMDLMTSLVPSPLKCLSFRRQHMVHL